MMLISAQGSEWVLDRVDVPLNETFEDIVLTAEVGDGPNGNIAIDDIVLLYGTCSATRNIGKSHSHGRLSQVWS